MSESKFGKERNGTIANEVNTTDWWKVYCGQCHLTKHNFLTYQDASIWLTAHLEGRVVESCASAEKLFERETKVM